MTTTLYRLPGQQQIDRGLAALRLTMAVTAQLRREGWKDHEPLHYASFAGMHCDEPECFRCTNKRRPVGYVPRHSASDSVSSESVGGAGSSYPGTDLLTAPTPNTQREPYLSGGSGKASGLLLGHKAECITKLCSCGKPAAHLSADPDSRHWACRVPYQTAP